MRVRVATPEDAEAVAAVLVASYPALMPAAYPPALLARALPTMVRPHLGLLASGRYYLAEAERGEPAGCGGWSDHGPGSSDRQPGRAHIRHFATHPRWIGRGVGRAIYRRCERDARAAGFTFFEVLASLNGEGFYAALGFRRLSIIAEMIGGVPFPSVRMERAIAPTPS